MDNQEQQATVNDVIATPASEIGVVQLFLGPAHIGTCTQQIAGPVFLVTKNKSDVGYDSWVVLPTLEDAKRFAYECWPRERRVKS